MPQTKQTKIRLVAVNGALVPCSEFVTLGQAAEYVGRRYMTGNYLETGVPHEFDPGSPVIKRLKRACKQGELAAFDPESAKLLGVAFQHPTYDPEGWTWEIFAGI